MRRLADDGGSSRKAIAGGLVGALCLALAACAAPGQNGKRATPTNEASGRPVVADRSEKVERVLWQDDFSFVRIEAAEAQIPVPNDHPVTLNPEQIRSVLAQIQVQKGRTTIEPVFLERELSEISGPIAMALTQAGPMQDVTFAVTAKRGILLNPFNRRVVTTGRVFYLQDQLNVIFGLVHGQYEGQLQATGYLRPFTPGSRDGSAARDGGVLPAASMQYAAAGRQDWVQIPQQAWTPATAAPAAAPAPSPPQTVAPAQPAPRVTGGPALQVIPQAATPPARDGEAQYQELERRLEVLKTLWEKKLITREQYEEKSRAILDEL